MSFLKWTKILPFCILQRLDNGSNRRNPVWIKFFDGWDYCDEPKYKEVKADVAEWFPGGVCVFTSEKYNLERKEQELESRLKCVKERLGK